MQKGVKEVLSALILALGIAGIGTLYLDAGSALLLGSVAGMVLLWTNEALPLGVVSLFPLILFPGFGILDLNAVADNYANPIIFLFLGGFMMAIATEKTGLQNIVAKKLLQIFPKTPFGIILSLGMTAAFLSSLLSNTTTTLMLIPIVMTLSNDTVLKTRFVLAVAFGASIGGIMTPIGTPPNLILLGYLEEQGMETLSFIHWIAMTSPLAMVMLLCMAFLLAFGVEKRKIGYQFETLILKAEHKRLLWILGSLALLLFVNSPIKPWYPGLGLNEKAILLFYGLLMFLPKIGFLEWEDTKKIPYEIIFLFGAGFAIAKAFGATGLNQQLAALFSHCAGMDFMIVIALLALFVSFATGVISNTALIAMVLPIVYSVGVETGFDTALMLMVATVCSSYAFMLPISTPPNAIAISSRAVRVKQMVKFGVVLNLIGVLLIVLFARFYWSMM